jgi:hypothetical protein
MLASAADAGGQRGEQLLARRAGDARAAERLEQDELDFATLVLLVHFHQFEPALHAQVGRRYRQPCGGNERTHAFHGGGVDQAEIAVSEGDRQAKTNRAEGDRQEMIARSQGEKQKRINEAEGRAFEIQQVAQATADGIRKIASAINEEGGTAAVNLRSPSSSERVRQAGQENNR